MNQFESQKAEVSTSYLSRNERWLIPLLGVAIILSMHTFLVDLFGASEGEFPVLQKFFPLPSWLVNTTTVLGLLISGWAVFHTETRSAAVIRTCLKLLVIPVAIFAIVLSMN